MSKHKIPDVHCPGNLWAILPYCGFYGKMSAHSGGCTVTGKFTVEKGQKPAVEMISANDSAQKTDRMED